MFERMAWPSWLFLEQSTRNALCFAKGINMLFSDWSALAFSLAALLQVYHALSYFFHLLRLSVSQSLNGAYHWSVLSRLCCRPKLQKCKSYFDFGSPNMSKLITYDVQLNMLDHGRHCTVDMAILEYCGTPWLLFQTSNGCVGLTCESRRQTRQCINTCKLLPWTDWKTGKEVGKSHTPGATLVHGVCILCFNFLQFLGWKGTQMS